MIPLVQVYSPTRPMAQAECGHLPLKSLSLIAKLIRTATGTGGRSILSRQAHAKWVRVGQVPSGMFQQGSIICFMNTTKDFGQSSQRGKEGGRTQVLEKLIAEHPFLKGLSPHQCRESTDCAMFIKFEPGELLLREGDPANRFYLILRGKVSVESYLSNRGVTPIQTGGW